MPIFLSGKGGFRGIKIQCKTLLQQNFFYFLVGRIYRLFNYFRFSPIGIMFLIAAEVVKMEDPVAELEALGLYMVTVLTGLAIHGFIILPLLYFAVVRKNPYKYIYGLLQAMATALGTASRYK